MPDRDLLSASVDDFELAVANFQDPKQEWRRLISEFVGTFLLVLVAAGAAMVAKEYPGTVSLAAAVVAPGMMVMAIIMFMGKISGAHLNPGVSIAFALRRDFPWRRVPGYVVVQIAGAIDQAVLAVTRDHLAAKGLAGLSFAAVASEAGTTRPALYRRWPTKLGLAVAAVTDLAEIDPPETSEDPFEDLVAELEHFRHCITDASALALAGVMLQDGVDPEFKRKYREQLVKPRRARIRSCLKRGIAAGDLDVDADLAVVGTFMTGSWYAFAIGGAKPPRDWARRTASLAWRACGGDPP